MENNFAAGWIKVYRSMATNGHFHMPHVAFKVWMFLLLTVNRFANDVCGVGEGWITYSAIRKACSDKQQGVMSNASINRALTYLEQNDYLQRIHTVNGGAQRIRIINYDLYQGETGCEVIPVPPESLNKKEIMNKTKEARMSERWVAFFESKFARTVSPTDYEKMERLRGAGVTDELIITVFEEAIKRKIVRALPWVVVFVSDMVPYGVRTVEDWQKLEAERAAMKDKPKPKKESPPAAPSNSKGLPPEVLAKKARREHANTQNL